MTSLPEVRPETKADGHSVGEGTRGRWVRVWIVLTVASVFGPYVAGGLRTEQLAIYAGALICGLGLLRHRALRSTLAPGRVVLGLWGLYFLTTVAGALLVRADWPWGPGSLVAGLDNAAMPLATMIVVATWVRLLSAREVLLVAARAIAVGMACNAVVALVSSFVGIGRLPFLTGFWASRGSGVTVAELASTSGRFSGVFNQPVEAGVAYTLAACCLVYVARSDRQASPAWWLPVWSLVLVGGLLCFSKVFVVGGVAILAGLVLSSRRHRLLLTGSAVATAAAVFVLGGLGWLGSWGASTTLAWYVESYQTGDSLTYTLSAGRFGDGDLPITAPPVDAEDSDLAEEPDDAALERVPAAAQSPGGLVMLAGEVVKLSPVLGLGAAGALVSYDSTWTEAVIVGGLSGALLMLGVHLALTAGVVGRWKGLLPHERRFGVAMVVLVWGSSLGMPSLTGNRESALVWIVLAALVLFRTPRARPGASR